MTTFADTPRVNPPVFAELGTGFALLVYAHAAVAFGLGVLTGFPFNPEMPSLLAMLLLILMPWFVWIMFMHLVYTVVVREKAERPLAAVAARLRACAFDFRWQADSVLRFLLAALFIASAGYLKELITVLQPFAWDEAFAKLDRWLHFGVDPWRLLMPVAGSFEATWALNMVYHAWFFAIYFCVFVACFAGGRVGMAFLVGFALTFAIGGNLLATIFSSAGPVYYERLGLGADFVPLMAHLETLSEFGHLPALDVQAHLWSAYETNGGHAAISAMPSMHVATSVLMACFAFRHSPVAGWVMSTFAAAIMVGSVHLGWHYAVDGYLGALVAWLCWRWGLRAARV